MLTECAGPSSIPVSEVSAGLCLEGWGSPEESGVQLQNFHSPH